MSPKNLASIKEGFAVAARRARMEVEELARNPPSSEKLAQIQASDKAFGMPWPAGRRPVLATDGPDSFVDEMGGVLCAQRWTVNLFASFEPSGADGQDRPRLRLMGDVEAVFQDPSGAAAFLGRGSADVEWTECPQSSAPDFSEAIQAALAAGLARLEALPRFHASQIEAAIDAPGRGASAPRL